MAKVNIHGKEYEPVVDRVKQFRDSHEDWAIVTEIILNDGEFVIMKAEIRNQDQEVVATGHAQEKYGSSNINQTSALENCETSAIGRALACYGMAGTEFASADEVANAIKQQGEGTTVYGRLWSPATEKQKAFLKKLYYEAMPDGDLEDYIRGEGKDPNKLDIGTVSEMIKELQSGVRKQQANNLEV